MLQYVKVDISGRLCDNNLKRAYSPFDYKHNLFYLKLCIIFSFFPYLKPSFQLSSLKPLVHNWELVPHLVVCPSVQFSFVPFHCPAVPLPLWATPLFPNSVIASFFLSCTLGTRYFSFLLLISFLPLLYLFSYIFAQIAIDLITDLPKPKGFDSIFSVVDHSLTKGIILIPTRKEVTSEEIATLLMNNLFQRFGIPDKVISDHDP